MPTYMPRFREGMGIYFLGLWFGTSLAGSIVNCPNHTLDPPSQQAAAMLHKARHERTRNRTRERALLHAEQLSEALEAPEVLAVGRSAGGTAQRSVEATAALRLSFAFTVRFPLHVSHTVLEFGPGGSFWIVL